MPYNDDYPTESERKKWKDRIRVTRRTILFMASFLTIIIAVITIAGIIFDNQQRTDIAIAEQRIGNIIEQEAQFVLNGSAVNATLLYANDAWVVDNAGGNKNYEQSWVGIDRIRERYAALQNFTMLKHIDVKIELKDSSDSASATADTMGAYIEGGVVIPINSNQGEKWNFQKNDSQWLITSFTYNLP